MEQPGAVEDDIDGSSVPMTHIRCTKCNELMDDPHCARAGCPWCVQCGLKTEA